MSGSLFMAVIWMIVNSAQFFFARQFFEELTNISKSTRTIAPLFNLSPLRERDKAAFWSNIFYPQNSTFILLLNQELCFISQIF
jgi:hypothetical protein